MAVLVARREQALEGRLPGQRAAAAVDVGLELVAELADDARHRHRRRIAQRAEALAEHAVADREEQLELGLLGLARLDLLQELHHPARPLAARRALAARLVHVDLRDPQRELHHAGTALAHGPPARSDA